MVLSSPIQWNFQTQQIVLHKNRDSSFTCLSLQASRDTTWTGVTFSYEFLEKKKNILWKLVKVQSSFAEQTVGYTFQETTSLLWA